MFLLCVILWVKNMQIIYMKYNIADILYKIVNQSLDEIITEEMIINA